jgi:alpha-1,2-mannosyltransferase
MKVAEFAKKKWLAFVLAPAVISYYFALGFLLRTRWYALDFSPFYYCAYALRVGINPYSADVLPLATQLGLMNNGVFRAEYPPTFILCFEPLTLARPQTAYWIWTGLNALALLAAVLILLSELWIDGRMFVIFAALAIVYEPLSENFIWSQAQIVLLLLLALNLRWMRSGNDVAAGFGLALAGLLKVFPLLLLFYLVLIKRLRAVVWTLMWIAAGGTLTLLFVGWKALEFFLKGPTIVENHWVTGISVNASISKIFVAAIGQPLPPAAEVARIAIIVLTVVAILAIGVHATLASVRLGRGDLAYGLWIVLAVFLFPITWIHHMVLLLIPLAQILTATWHGRATLSTTALGIASYIAVAAVIPLFWIDWMSSLEWLLTPSRAISQVAGVLAFCSAYQLAVTAPVPVTSRA